MPNSVFSELRVEAFELVTVGTIGTVGSVASRHWQSASPHQVVLYSALVFNKLFLITICYGFVAKQRHRISNTSNSKPNMN